LVIKKLLAVVGVALLLMTASPATASAGRDDHPCVVCW
jgi:hypothetical protein